MSFSFEETEVLLKEAFKATDRDNIFYKDDGSVAVIVDDEHCLVMRPK